MADGASGTGYGSVEVPFATDLIGGYHYPRYKLSLGADGSAVDAVAGAGAVGTGVQRVTLASDDPAVSHLSTIASADLMLGTDFSTVFGTASLILATQADDVANTSDGLQTTAFGYYFDGTTWDRVRGDSTNGMLVNLGTNNDVTVTGTVDLGATDNAVLDAIAASLAGTLTVGLPTGAATAANQSTIIGHLDGVEGLLTTIDGDTGNIATAVQLIDNMIYTDNAAWSDGASAHALIGGIYQSSPQTITDGRTAPALLDANGRLVVAATDNGGSLTVDYATTGSGTATGALRVELPTNGTGVIATVGAVTAITNALPAGTNAIGKLAANSGVDIGDVDITSIAAGDNLIGRFKLSDGTDVADILDLSNSNPLAVAIVDGSGDQITSFGGGTQYTEDAAAAANPVGTATILVRADTPAGIASADGDNVAMRGTDYGAAYVTLLDTSGSPVAVGGGTQYTEDATAAANPTGNAIMLVREDARAGSLVSADGDNVALRGNNKGEAYVIDTDGNALLTTIDADTGNIATAVQIMDDWDESDRAKVNLIVGQAGIAGGAGAVGATVPRVTLASDDPGVALLGTIDTDTGNIATAVQLIDDVIYVDDADWTDSTSKHMLAGGVYQSSPQTVTDGDTGPFLIDANGRLVVAATDNGGSLTVDYATTGSGTATGALRVELPTNGTGVIATVGAVTAITNALPAGTNAIGKLAANSGVDIGDVDVTSVIPGTGATNLGKAEDAAHTTGDVGVMALTVRANSAAATSGADGDYQPLITDTNGRLHVNAVMAGGSVVSGAFASGALSSGSIASGAIASGAVASGAVASGAFASGSIGSGAIASGAIAAGAIAAGATSIADNEDVASADGDRGVKMLVTRRDTPAATSGTTGDYEFLQTAGGYLWVHDNKGLSNLAFSAAFTTLTRPANTTAYSASDSISDNATAGSVTALSATISDTNDDPIFISEILINSTDTGLAGKKLRANLFNADPTASSGVGGGDNAAYSQKKNGYIGTFVGTLESGFSDGTVGRLVPSFRDTNYTPAGGFVVTKPTSGAKTLYIQFVAEEAFTPSANSTTIIATARGWQARAV